MKLQEAIANSLELAYDGGKNYVVKSESGDYVYTAKAQSINEHNTSEDLKNMNWGLYADETIDTLDLYSKFDPDSNYTVEFDPE
ncbi:MAG: hypothetical protein WC998_08830 [Candidatus Paceibacterota bacterium]